VIPAATPPERVGVLVVNLGTPDDPTTPAVRRYLREFLSDPRVIDIPAPARWLLLNAFILPFRPRTSAEAYRKIWTTDSPLRIAGQQLVEGMSRELGDGWLVELGMRYGRPAIAPALQRLEARGATRLVVLPLYPQAASSSSGSSLELVFRELASRWNVPSVAIVPPFFADDRVLQAWRETLAPRLAEAAADHVLFSFHGLPERHVRKGDAHGHGCLSRSSCCDALGESNRDCYRAQCYATARLMAERLALQPGSWSVSFQSRLGRTPWIRPFTDEVVVQLASQGTKRLAVCCPCFVADCLETLEEIAMQNREMFLTHGGEAFDYVPCLNSSPGHVDALEDVVVRHSQGWPELSGAWSDDTARARSRQRALELGAAR
jgi:ferrochelatase